MTDKSILVTGSSRGIGRAIALELAQTGYDLVLHCRSNIEQVQKVATMVEESGVQAHVLSFDISDRESAAESLTNYMDQHGAFYGVVCNAGLARDSAFPAMRGEEWDTVLHSNLDGFFNVLHPVVMPMIRRRRSGRIVTIASLSGLVGNRGQVNYSAAKAGIIGATKALAIELAKRKITVNCVAPGLIDTEMLDGIPLEGVIKSIPMQRLGTPQEVAKLVRFLVSEDASYITRQVLSVNGGLF